MNLFTLCTFLLITLKLISHYTPIVTVPEATKVCIVAGGITACNQMPRNEESLNVFSSTNIDATTLQQNNFCSHLVWDYSETAATDGYVPNAKHPTYNIDANWAAGRRSPPTVSSGSMINHWFDSNIVDDRFVDVWLPDGYNTSLKYPVLYMHDGQMLFDASTTWNQQEWNVDGILGNLIENGTIDRTIVVAIYNNGNKRHAEFFPEKVINTIPEPQKSELEALFSGTTRADDYLQFIVTELKPFIDNNYSTYPDQQHTFIAGSSMGGLISLYAFCEYPNIFSRTACISTHWIGTFANNSQIPNALNNYLNQNLPIPTNRKIYFDHGTVGLDANYGPYQLDVDNTLTAKGYTSENWESEVFPGADHNENSWQARFNIPATFILSNTILSIDNKSLNIQLKVFPNPSQTKIFIEPFEKVKDKLIKIYDNNGKTLLNQQLKSNGIDISNFQSGGYFIHIDKSIIKFIKN